MDEIELSPQMVSTIEKMRRRINDTDTPPSYDNTLLYGYIADAVDELEGTNYSKGVEVSDGDFNMPINPTDQTIYSLQAAIIFIQGVKARADRDNFSLRKQNLSVDTSGQSSDHAETLKILSQELDKKIAHSIFRASFSAGFRVE